MTERPDKNSRKASLDRWKSHQRTDARSKLPLPDSEMKKLFDMLNDQLPRVGCDHTLRLVSQWCDSHAIPFAKVESWLRENGGFCDCEALANAEEAWQDTLHGAGS